MDSHAADDSGVVQDDREKDLFEDDDDEDEEDPRLEAIMGFVAEKLSTFDERIEAVEGAVRDVRRQLQENEQQQQEQQQQQQATPRATMHSYFSPSTSTPFKVPEKPEDVGDEALRAAIQGVWMPAPRSRQELLTDIQCRYIVHWLGSHGRPTGNKAQVESLLRDGYKDGMWTPTWVPQGSRVDLFTHVKNKLKGMKTSQMMQSKFEKAVADRRGVKL